MESYVTRNAAGTLRLTGSRVSLGSVVHAYWRGETPESIVQSFPSLTLEKVHGALAYYLRNRKEVDLELERQAEEGREERAASLQANREFRQRLLLLSEPEDWIGTMVFLPLRA